MSIKKFLLSRPIDYEVYRKFAIHYRLSCTLVGHYHSHAYCDHSDLFLRMTLHDKATLIDWLTPVVFFLILVYLAGRCL